MRIDIWSDVVCPWCYVGKRRFEKALARFPAREDVQIVHRSFELNPQAPKGRTSDRRTMLMTKYGWSEEQARQADRRMEQTAAAEGLVYTIDGGLSGNTVEAHELLHLARERGLQDQVLERFFRGHFSERRSVFERESLLDLAAEGGLDRAEAAQALAAGTYTDAVRRDEAEARAIGVNGVPFFVLDGRFAVSGAQSPEMFLDALNKAGGPT